MESLKTNKFLMKLKKKPSFCLFEGTDSIPKYTLAETQISQNTIALDKVTRWYVWTGAINEARLKFPL
jgi:hypothetical protein